MWTGPPVVTVLGESEQEFLEEFKLNKEQELASQNFSDKVTAIIVGVTVGPCDEVVDKEDAPQSASNGHAGAVTVVLAMLASISFPFSIER